MKVLMLGWEFPPFISGGLGTACYGLTKAMSQLGMKVVFVLPRPVQSQYSTHVRLMVPAAGEEGDISQVYTIDEFERVQFRTVDATLFPYQSPASYVQQHRQRQAAALPGSGPSGESESFVAVPTGPVQAHNCGDQFIEIER